jgi:hypothetical protein
MVPAVDNAIGGYFELELPLTNGNPYPQAVAYQSARAAFMALLRQSPQVKRVWMPHYICDSMLSPVNATGKEVCFYNLDDQLTVSTQVALRTGDLLLYVNYFGICTAQCAALLQRFDPEQIVLDYSQAFYAPPRNCYANIYSPRKFFGVPDGGLLVTASPVTPPALQDTGSESRMWHLIKRLGGTAESGYQDFKRAEDSLDDMEPRGMSTITRNLFQAVNFDAVRDARDQNFAYLRQHLDKTNTLTMPTEVEGPHCYPYLPDHPVSKDILIQHRVFVATYWPDVLKRVAPATFEAQLVSQCLPIPCDQRYSEATLSRILNLL